VGSRRIPRGCDTIATWRGVRRRERRRIPRGCDTIATWRGVRRVARERLILPCVKSCRILDIVSARYHILFAPLTGQRPRGPLGARVVTRVSRRADCPAARCGAFNARARGRARGPRAAFHIAHIDIGIPTIPDRRTGMPIASPDAAHNVSSLASRLCVVCFAFLVYGTVVTPAYRTCKRRGRGRHIFSVSLSLGAASERRPTNRHALNEG
jgi:hypothetical protein